MSCSSGVRKDQPTLAGVLGRLLPKCLLELDISTNSYNWTKNYFCLFLDAVLLRKPWESLKGRQH